MKTLNCERHVQVKTVIKTVLFSIFFLVSTSKTIAQSGWTAGNFYSYQGGADVTCGNVYTVQNPYNGIWEGWQKCRRRNWYQEYHSGYVYLWGPSGWYTQWQEGNFWTFNWYDYDNKVW